MTERRGNSNGETVELLRPAVVTRSLMVRAATLVRNALVFVGGGEMRRTSQALRSLDDYTLRDIGIESRQEIPFAPYRLAGKLRYGRDLRGTSARDIQEVAA